MTTFIKFRDEVEKSFNRLALNGNIFQSAIVKDELWDLYLDSFPEGSDPIYRERTEHSCNCCRSYIRNVGRALGKDKEGNLVSVWDNLPIEGPYKIVADAMAEACRAAGISGIYLNDEQVVGRKESYETMADGSVHTWNHFFQILPVQAFTTNGNIGSRKGVIQTGCKVLKRSIVEIDYDTIQSVLELMDAKLLHRGNEFAPIVKGLANLKREYDEQSNKELFIWDKTVEMVKADHDCNIRGTAIGTLLVDLAGGEDLETAVKKYESKVAGANYKRTTALITPKQREACKKEAQELGIEPSFPRRFATKEDISVNDVLYADSSVKPFMEDSIFDMVEVKKPAPVKFPDTIEEISAEDFIEKFLPKAESIEVFLENKHESNLMSVIAPINADAPCIMKWDNNFSWSYNGEMAESDMRARVRELGGRVDGVLRFTHSWNHNGNNQSLMDLHVFLPTHTYPVTAQRYRESMPKEIHNFYGSSERVGWNNRKHMATGGNQDVDYTAAPGKNVPIENITFPDMHKLPEGEYKFKIHNWKARNPNTEGFKAEIELNGQVFSYDYTQPVEHHQWITVATAVLKNGVFTITHHLDESHSAKDIWGLGTTQFHKVNMVMRSPNMWEESNKTGNDHLFFILDGCLNPDDARGFYNEFLPENLYKHRKVFEILSANLKAKHSDEQLSGVGFSSTLRNDVTVRVKGEVNRVLKIKF